MTSIVSAGAGGIGDLLLAGDARRFIGGAGDGFLEDSPEAEDFFVDFLRRSYFRILPFSTE